MRGIVARFGSTVALDSVDFTVATGSVHALLGENGAGKSTLARIAFGLLPPHAGTVFRFGEVAAAEVGSAIRSGVGMVHQHLSLVPNLSPAENFALGGSGLFRPAAAAAALRGAEEAFGLLLPDVETVSQLSLVEQQRLEILKALGRGARLLILDEPTAVLAPSESRDLLRWIRAFAAGGGSVVLVTHKLAEATTVADAVTVLRRGRVTLARDARGVTEEELARAMFPDPLRAALRAAASVGEAVVAVRGASLTGSRGASTIREASLEIRRGEIVGLAAVEGSGHRALLAGLAGLSEPTVGTITLPPRIALIPADRARDAVVPEFTLVENVAVRGLGARHGVMPWPALAERTQSLIERFSIVSPSAHARLGSLSGGNQQRLVVARELEADVDLLIADNPTRGLDLRATAFVHDQIRAAASRGAGVVLHSSDLDEVLALATRVLVVHQGRVREVAFDREIIGRAMLGAGEEGAA